MFAQLCLRWLFLYRAEIECCSLVSLNACVLQSGPVNRLKLKLSVQFFNPDEDFEDEILTEMWTLLCFKRKKSGHEPLAWEAKPRKSGWVAVVIHAAHRHRASFFELPFVCAPDQL